MCGHTAGNGEESLISIEANPNAESDELCDHFFIELDPIRDGDFLRRLIAVAPAKWVSLENLCDGLPNLPDGAAEIVAQIPGRFVLCHFDWAGAAIDPRQPKHAIAIGDTASMYHRMQLLGIHEPEA